MRFCSFVAVLASICAPASAQPPQATVFIGPAEADPTRLRLWLEHAEQGVRGAGYEVVSDPVVRATARLGEEGAIGEERLSDLDAVERFILDARTATAELNESEALRKLAEARTLIERNADLPGAAEWLCEVETAIGIVAAQMGRNDLAEMALTRAASLDPTRGIGAAEAPPEVVARAVEVKQRVATGPLSTFEVRSSAPDSVVFIDDVEIGPAPRTARVSVGRHVLRVEAAGHRSYGAVIDALEGTRPPIDVLLSADPELEALRELAHAVDERDADRIGSLLAASRLDGAWIVEVGTGARERSLVWPCTRAGCSAARRLEIDQVPIVLGSFEARTSAEVARAIAADREWLFEPVPVYVEPEIPLFERWYVWTAIGVGAAIGVAFTILTIALAQPPAVHQQDQVVRCGRGLMCVSE
jgi:hypothetical protein